MTTSSHCIHIKSDHAPLPAVAPSAVAAAGTSSPLAQQAQQQQQQQQPQKQFTLEEEEAKLKAGTLKDAAFKGLKALGLKGGSPDEVYNYCMEQGIKTEWPASGKQQLQKVKPDVSCQGLMLLFIAIGAYRMDWINCSCEFGHTYFTE